ncbi:monoheme cytochrome C [Pseudozobellia thermophila]|uniref:Sulfite dehydrogenase (Cytochrome) subunit SorB n=1 Tax=Pseudozobellia thermophila TaxID=192903 RepID=A0A1M6F051_9FLAO|nr:monoheme cytochrome C [Pseudozobellia thermophila]SHI91009.1 sulfite dehydrogenase (cytochrome) subunit SorB [Pseudozobellia thermophila]
MKDQDHDKLKKGFQGVYRILILACVVVALFSVAMVYLLGNPDLSLFQGSKPDTEVVAVGADDDDFDKVENGIHVRTGFIDAPGMMETVQNCTNCHSAKLVMQNRMNKERWKATIKWMQETQNLWDLGKNEDIIIDYLVTNYPPKKKGRREALTNIEWYELKD